MSNEAKVNELLKTIEGATEELRRILKIEIDQLLPIGGFGSARLLVAKGFFFEQITLTRSKQGEVNVFIWKAENDTCFYERRVQFMSNEMICDLIRFLRSPDLRKKLCYVQIT